VITAATAEIPMELLKQLKTGGRLVAPLGDNNTQTMTLVVRTGEDSFDYSSHGLFVFVPMLKGTVNGK
jgi:protein-L-isoaspartate(D-aspartate) O-methyltransferase